LEEAVDLSYDRLLMNDLEVMVHKTGLLQPSATSGCINQFFCGTIWFTEAPAAVNWLMTNVWS
jgi:hypothetical protein